MQLSGDDGDEISLNLFNNKRNSNFIFRLVQHKSAVRDNKIRNSPSWKRCIGSDSRLQFLD